MYPRHALPLQSKEHCMECMRFISSGRHRTWQFETVWLYLTGNFKGGEHNRCYAIFVNIYFSIYTSFRMHGLHDSSTEELNVSTSPVCTCFCFKYFGLRKLLSLHILSWFLSSFCRLYKPFYSGQHELHSGTSPLAKDQKQSLS